MKKEKGATNKNPMPRFKEGSGVASWKIAAAMVIALAVGIGGGIAMNQSKHKPVHSDYELGLEAKPASSNVEG